MRELPILFNGDMVRAILSGQKTQTRRIISPLLTPEHKWRGWIFESSCKADVGKASWGIGEYPLVRDALRIRPTCSVGDRLWVRETWCQMGQWGQSYPDDDEWRTWSGSKHVFYRADGAPPNDPNKTWRTRPSIHMPRWASRITLEITGVRVERLQDISAEDCWAEGIESAGWDCEKYGSVVHCFEDLWRSTGGDWDANPWAWVIEFKRIGEAME